MKKLSIICLSVFALICYTQIQVTAKTIKYPGKNIGGETIENDDGTKTYVNFCEGDRKVCFKEKIGIKIITMQAPHSKLMLTGEIVTDIFKQDLGNGLSSFTRTIRPLK